MAQGRVDVNTNLQLNTRLTPQASPVDTYAQPARTPMDNNLERLSKALEGFSSSVDTYGQVAAIKANAADKQTLQLQEAKIGGMSKDEIAQARKDGTLPAYADPLKQAGIDAAVGAREGSQDSDALQNFFKTEYDPSVHGEPRQYIEKFQKEAIAGMNPVRATQYIRQTNPLFDWVDGHMKDVANQKVVEDAHTSAYTLIGQTVDSGIKAGDDPGKVQAAVRAQYANIGQKGILGLTNKDIDNTVLAVARDNALTNPSYAIALASAQTVAPDGTKVGFLINPRTADQAQAIIASASSALQKKAKVAWENSQAQIGGNAILNKTFPQTKAPSFTNADGSVSEVSDDEFKKKAVQGYLTGSPDVAKQRHENPTQQLSREFNDLRAAGLQHPQLKTQVNGIAARLSPSSLSDPDQKQQVLTMLKTGQWMLNESQNSLHDYVQKQEDRDAISVFNAFKTVPNADGTTYSDEEALAKAIEITNPQIRPSTNFSQDDQAQIDGLMGGIVKGQGWFGFGSTRPGNYSAIENKVQYLARGFIAAGLGHEDAIAKAADAVQKSSLIYNGVMLPKVNGFVVDDDFQPTVKSFIDDWAAKNPKTLKDYGIDASDIAILPSGNVNGDSGGHFRLVSKDGLDDILDDNHDQVIFDANDLRNKRAADKKARDAAAIKAAAQK
ncbi:hypothetical protein [Rhizobium rhizogenes]|uniref:hypothetical protein n=1 Tax=Rhizobium rhizogenes TaxID=359 RepID=UPI0015727C68|nr:hypothetical protein [Rhizobium rhizogenes]NTH18456.1 hypothetical protein [Rhizobium rhizogenes]NTH31430.1 hypothetical protein [Rhizobium rhizogenes]